MRDAKSKLVKIVFLGIIAVIGSIFVVGFFLPQTVSVERSIIIKSSSESVFPYVNSMKAFHTWSPWAKLDPKATVEYFGPDSGVGAGMSWNSKDKRVGKGRQVIVESQPNRYVKTELSFDDKSTGYAYWRIEEADGSVVVVWGFDMDFGMNPIMRYLGLMMDDMLGKLYVAGLTDLKMRVESEPKLVNEVIHYQVGDTQLKGYMAYPSNAQNAPGVLIVHEWWGNNDYARKRADMLAQLGYVAFALDMYGDNKVTGHPKEANAFMMEVLGTDGLIKQRFMAAYDLLAKHPKSDPERLAAIGYCFGGGVVLSMARSGVDLKGVASFHGSLQGLAPVADDVSARFVLFNGAEDPFVPEKAIAQFKQEMDSVALPYEFVNYPGAVHGFTNPDATAKGEEYGLPLRYSPEADRDSWEKLQTFFDEVL